MSILSEQLNDDRFVGCAAFEVVSFPEMEALHSSDKRSIEDLFRGFTHILREYFDLGSNCNSMIEFLWVTEKVANQPFRSRVRIFCVVRLIAGALEDVESKIAYTTNHLSSALLAKGFEVSGMEGACTELLGLLDSVSTDALIAVEKSEKIAATSASVYHYYYPEVIPSNNQNNFASLISLLSELEDCCISFQLFPVRMEQQEKLFLNEVVGELSSIVDGIMLQREVYRDSAARDPLRALSHYHRHMNSPLFLYNILVAGQKQGSSQLAAKLVSLLQSGRDKVLEIDCRQADLSGEQISLKEQFLPYPWNVNNRLVYAYRDTAILNSIPMAQSLFRLPFMVTPDEAAVFFRLPLHEKGMGALQSAQVKSITEHFDSSVVAEDNIQFGRLANPDAAEVTIGCPVKAFTKHALLVGMPGSGKTTFSINLLLQFARKKIPFLAIEPTKAEYRALLNTIPDLQIFTPGNNTVSPFIINPFIPPRGITIEQYIPSLAVAFKAAFAMPSPLDSIFLKAINASYVEHGWKDYSVQGDPDVRPFGLYEFILKFKQIVNASDYGKEIKGNLESAGVIRLMNLIEQNSNIFDTIHTVSLDDILQHPTVVELNSIDNTEQKALIIALLLISIGVHTKNTHEADGTLKNIILIDEAHVLLGGGAVGLSEEANPQAITVKSLQDMIAEIRAYGTGIVIADQSPTKVSREVVANTDIKVSFRLVQSVEKELIADSTNMDAKTQQQLSRLKPGEAYMYFSGLENPQRIVTEDIRDKEGIPITISNDEVAEKMTYWADKQDQLKPFPECVFSEVCRKGCDFRLRSQASHNATKILMQNPESLSDEKTLMNYLKSMDKILSKITTDLSDEKHEQMIQCTRIRLVRKVRLEKGISVKQSEVVKIIRGGAGNV